MLPDYEICRKNINAYKNTLESIYKRLDGKTDTGSKSSTVSKNTILMAIWGQVPGFDSITRRRFEKWTHSPAPEKLPHLNTRGMWH